MPSRVARGSIVLAWLVSLQGHAATYYVRNGGNDAADGRSHATAWATLQKVNSFSFSAGDVVLLHEGHAWRGAKLVVKWPGTSSSHAAVGAYYLDNGTPRRGFKAGRPIIDGQDRIPTRYEPLVNVTASRVRVENLAVINSEGRGVEFNRASFGQAAGLVVTNTYDCGIVFIEAHDGLVEGNHVSETDRQKPEDGLNWCAAIAAVRSDRTTMRRNVVERAYGEGLNTNYGSRDTVIEDNFVFGVRAAGIYVDSAPRTTVRRNIVLGTADATYWRYSGVVGPGIMLNNEAYSHVEGGGKLDSSVRSSGARIYNNLVAYTRRGIGFWGGLTNDSFENALIYNNTLVDNDQQFGTIGNPMPNSVFANNILLSISAGTSDVTGTASGLRTRNNYYSKGNPGGIYAHSGNRYSGTQLARMTGWRTVRDPKQLSWRDFLPQKGSASNGAGDRSHIVAGDTHTYHLDINSQPHNQPIDMGGVRFSEGGPKVPRGPRLVTQ